MLLGEIGRTLNSSNIQ